MKKISVYLMIAFFAGFSMMASAQNKGKISTFGDKIDATNAIEASTLVAKMGGKDSLNIKVKGKIKEVCQRKGCWMNIDLGGGKEMKVRFKDYGFFVPKDAAGKTVVMQGVAYKDETTVEELRHYAEDAGKSKTEIQKITKPEKNTGFEATGVIIYND
ncbi:MAG: DUF4920 domain-containing protein [Bacteroidetes bacterium]|nr:DUF4920 domain-containing protein [Bacteroidota bacterium]